jgi:competence transcription factor ComK
LIEYIKHHQLLTYVYKNNETEIINKPVISYIKSLCYKHLFNYEGYKDAIKRVFGFKYKIPLYIDESLQLIPIERVRNYENIWVNFKAIDEIKVKEDTLEIYFYSHQKITIKSKMKTMKNQIKRLEQIRIYVSKHFHA